MSVLPECAEEVGVEQVAYGSVGGGSSGFAVLGCGGGASASVDGWTYMLDGWLISKSPVTDPAPQGPQSAV